MSASSIRPSSAAICVRRAASSAASALSITAALPDGGVAAAALSTSSRASKATNESDARMRSSSAMASSSRRRSSSVPSSLPPAATSSPAARARRAAARRSSPVSDRKRRYKPSSAARRAAGASSTATVSLSSASMSAIAGTSVCRTRHARARTAADVSGRSVMIASTVAETRVAIDSVASPAPAVAAVLPLLLGARIASSRQSTASQRVSPARSPCISFAAWRNASAASAGRPAPRRTYPLSARAPADTVGETPGPMAPAMRSAARCHAAAASTLFPSSFNRLASAAARTAAKSCAPEPDSSAPGANEISDSSRSLPAATSRPTASVNSSAAPGASGFRPARAAAINDIPTPCEPSPSLRKNVNAVSNSPRSRYEAMRHAGNLVRTELCVPGDASSANHASAVAPVCTRLAASAEPRIELANPSLLRRSTETSPGSIAALPGSINCANQPMESCPRSRQSG